MLKCIQQNVEMKLIFQSVILQKFKQNNVVL